MSAADKDRGALEEAVALFDELMAIVNGDDDLHGLGCNAKVIALHNRRQALELRLAKRRAALAKLRSAVEAVEKERRGL